MVVCVGLICCCFLWYGYMVVWVALICSYSLWYSCCGCRSGISLLLLFNDFWSCWYYIMLFLLVWYGCCSYLYWIALQLLFMMRLFWLLKLHCLLLLVVVWLLPCFTIVGLVMRCCCCLVFINATVNLVQFVVIVIIELLRKLLEV